LKSLQISLTSVSLPWVPVGSAETRYLINEIVLGEECDVDQAGVRMSHFELYLRAMEQLGASTTEIKALQDCIANGTSIQQAIEEKVTNENIKKFLSYTFEIALYAPAHVKAAVFTFGREDLIPSMFHKLLEQLYSAYPEKVSTFKYYIERHIEVDGDHHSHLAINMVTELCGNDPQKWEEATTASKKALQMRYLLWDAVLSKTLALSPATA
jgi:pyrroloquinoline quinone (PQQ) biosynthesis protein C